MVNPVWFQTEQSSPDEGGAGRAEYDREPVAPPRLIARAELDPRRRRNERGAYRHRHRAATDETQQNSASASHMK